MIFGFTANARDIEKYKCKEVAFERVDLDYVKEKRPLGGKVKNTKFNIEIGSTKLKLDGYYRAPEVIASRFGNDYVYVNHSKDLGYNASFRFLKESTRNFLLATSIDRLATGPFFKNEIYECFKTSK